MLPTENLLLTDNSTTYDTIEKQTIPVEASLEKQYYIEYRMRLKIEKV